MKLRWSTIILPISAVIILTCASFGFYTLGYSDGYSKGTRETTDTCVVNINELRDYFINTCNENIKEVADKCVESIKSLGK